MKKNLFDVLRGLEDKNKKIQSVFDDVDFLDEEISIVADIILESLGTPEDNTTTEKDKNNWYCTDLQFEVLMNFMEGKITEKSAIAKIKKINGKQR